MWCCCFSSKCKHFKWKSGPSHIKNSAYHLQCTSSRDPCRTVVKNYLEVFFFTIVEAAACFWNKYPFTIWTIPVARENSLEHLKELEPFLGTATHFWPTGTTRAWAEEQDQFTWIVRKKKAPGEVHWPVGTASTVWLGSFQACAMPGFLWSDWIDCMDFQPYIVS